MIVLSAVSAFGRPAGSKTCGIYAGGDANHVVPLMVCMSC